MALLRRLPPCAVLPTPTTSTTNRRSSSRRLLSLLLVCCWSLAAVVLVAAPTPVCALESRRVVIRGRWGGWMTSTTQDDDFQVTRPTAGQSAAAGAVWRAPPLLLDWNTQLSDRASFTLPDCIPQAAAAAAAARACLPVYDAIVQQNASHLAASTLGDTVSLLSAAKVATGGASVVFVVAHGLDHPMVSYVSTSSNFTCAPSLPASVAPLVCTSRDTDPTSAAYFVAVLTPPTTAAIYSGGDYEYSINITGNSSMLASGTLQTDLLIISFARMQAFAQVMSDIESVASSIDSRRNSSRVAVGFLWFFVAVTVWFLICLSAVFHTWVWPALSRPRYALLLWGFLWLLITVLISAFAGLGGFVAVTVLMAVFCACTNLVYCCVQLRKRQAARMLGDQQTIPTKSPTQTDQKATELPSPPALPPPSAAVAPSSPAGGGVAGISLLSNDFNAAPHAMGSKQKSLISNLALLILVSFVICVAIFGIWQVDDYLLWSRVIPQGPEVEIIPQSLAKGTSAVYTFDGYATKLKMNNVFFSVSTQWCGSHYAQSLTTAADKKLAIYDAFIEPYGIDMSQFEPSDYLQYATVNDWFKRPLRAGVRAVAAPHDDRVIVSPADARIIVFNSVPRDSQIWIKGENFNVRTLIGAQGFSSDFEDGAMAIVRLAPQDYHRFHVPVAGNITTLPYLIDGGLHSVNADGMTSKNDAQYNQRRVLVATHPIYGKYAYIAIGASCVGSVVIDGLHQNSHVTKGEELGFFQFGGSTIALVFPKGAVTWDDDLLTHSHRRIETHVYLGMRIGTFNTAAT